MSRISGKETKPEIFVRKFLFSKGFRYRKNYSKLPGKPDVVLPKYRVVIFIHGCFWHHHTCKAAKLPETRREFWANKINSNVERDYSNQMAIEKEDWKVIVVWQCELKNKKLAETRLNKLQSQILENVQSR